MKHYDVVEGVVVDDCSRCGFRHGGLTMRALLNDARFTHWTMCPVTNQPVLARIFEKDAQVSAHIKHFATIVSGSGENTIDLTV
jgi:hypothetical protein